MNYSNVRRLVVLYLIRVIVRCHQNVSYIHREQYREDEGKTRRAREKNAFFLVIILTKRTKSIAENKYLLHPVISSLFLSSTHSVSPFIFGYWWKLYFLIEVIGIFVHNTNVHHVWCYDNIDWNVNSRVLASNHVTNVCLPISMAIDVFFFFFF